MQLFILNELTGEQLGPYDQDQVRQLIGRKKIKPKTLVRSGNSDWQRAGVLLKDVFIAVQEEAKQRKQAAAESRRSSTESVEPPVIETSTKESKPRWSDPLGEDSVPPVATPQPMAKPMVTPRRRNQRGLFSQLFGTTRPTPYWGFRVVGALINVLIALLLLATVASVVIGLIMAIITVANPPESGSVAVLVLMIAGQILMSMLLAAMWICLLIFYRNLIDWLTDMQDHAAAIRAHLTGQPREDI